MTSLRKLFNVARQLQTLIKYSETKGVVTNPIWENHSKILKEIEEELVVHCGWCISYRPAIGTLSRRVGEGPPVTLNVCQRHYDEFYDVMTKWEPFDPPCQCMDCFGTNAYHDPTCQDMLDLTRDQPDEN